MSDYQSLIERVEGLSGACREADYALFDFFDPEKSALTVYAGSLEGTAPAYMAPFFTASIDAALSLVERKLPGCAAGVVLGAFADVLSAGGYRSDEPLQSQLARAIILALLRALQSQEEGR